MIFNKSYTSLHSRELQFKFKDKLSFQERNFLSNVLQLFSKIYLVKFNCFVVISKASTGQAAGQLLPIGARATPINFHRLTLSVEASCVVPA